VKMFRASLCVAAALGVSACVSLFPNTPPAQLYTFSVNTPASPAGEIAREFNVQRMPTNFTREAEGSQILTVDGDQAAYIAKARWDAPAQQLFDEAVTAAFDDSTGPVRLLSPGDGVSAHVSLQLDVQTFEARYLAGPKAAPTVVVSVHATLVNAVDRKVLSDHLFESQRAASDNRVSAIVDAFNSATTDVLGRIVDWTGRQGAPS
jgi:cholesterol transport system auxiliary component